jgi:hypothetical protein
MRIIDKRHHVGRRTFLRAASLTVPAAALVSAGIAGSAQEALAASLQSLKPKTALTLARVARDIYPHDTVPDRFYITAIGSLDTKAKADPAVQALLETGIAKLDSEAVAKHRHGYANLEEADRVALLQVHADTPFFKAVRSDLVVSFYNQPDLWVLFGYEGSSFEHGGYIHRGFNDIDWLTNV